jgi:hypothetical protein
MRQRRCRDFAIVKNSERRRRGIEEEEEEGNVAVYNI